VSGLTAVDGLFADPNLVVFDDTYHLYLTTDGIADWGSTSFRAFSSTDLSHWNDHGEILHLGSDVRWARQRAWAPTAVRRGDRYFFYFTAENNIGVAVGPSPVGPFTDLGRPLIAAGDYPGVAIDPSVFVDDDGQPYLLWGNTVAHAVPLNEDMTSFDPGRVMSWDLPGFREAPWMHRYDGTYYLSWSENDTREASYQVCYATGPTPAGPWTERGLLVQQRPEKGILGTGHHSITRAVDEGWLIAYHRFAIPNGSGYQREVVIDRLTHNGNGLLEPILPSLETFRPSQPRPHHNPNTRE
jgi:beta-xylosidase